MILGGKMDKLLIEGGKKIEGNIKIHGAKNSILPILAATVLCEGDCVLHNCPIISDVEISLKILEYLGAKIKVENHTIIINTNNIHKYEIPDFLMREMRSSIIFWGAVLSRMKKAKVSLPGGCELGPRPIDLHLDAMKHMGLVIEEYHGYMNCFVRNNLKGANISLSFPSVGATENTMLAAVFADGITTITNAAREPEILDLANFLNKSGAKISGAGQGEIIIEGVKTLHGIEHEVIPDRIEAITYMSAAVATRGDLLLEEVYPEHMSAVLKVFDEMGCQLDVFDDKIKIATSQRPKAIKLVRTMPYPGFPTDAQTILMAVSCFCQGTSMFIENIFASRYKHVWEFLRLGASIKVDDRIAVVSGTEKLFGTFIEAYDLRGAAALVVAALGSHGYSELTGCKYLARGYEKIVENFNSIGAKMKTI
jgi:UDP-N-acetylglucosamine 1-carboxyvinyltransferase